MRAAWRSSGSAGGSGRDVERGRGAGMPPRDAAREASRPRARRRPRCTTRPVAWSTRSDGVVPQPARARENAGARVVGAPGPARSLDPARRLVRDEPHPARPRVELLLPGRRHELLARLHRLARDEAPAGVLRMRRPLRRVREDGEPGPAHQRTREGERVGREADDADGGHGGDSLAPVAPCRHMPLGRGSRRASRSRRIPGPPGRAPRRRDRRCASPCPATRGAPGPSSRSRRPRRSAAPGRGGAGPASPAAPPTRSERAARRPRGARPRRRWGGNAGRSRPRPSRASLAPRTPAAAPPPASPRPPGTTGGACGSARRGRRPARRRASCCGTSARRAQLAVPRGGSGDGAPGRRGRPSWAPRAARRKGPRRSRAPARRSP